MRQFAALQLRNESYLESLDEGITIENIVDSEIMPTFEDDVKRNYDCNKDTPFYFRLRGLRENPVNPRLKKHSFVLSP
jgi:hypothetical protein